LPDTSRLVELKTGKKPQRFSFIAESTLIASD